MAAAADREKALQEPRGSACRAEAGETRVRSRLIQIKQNRFARYGAVAHRKTLG
jgi:hypothetical protein